MKPSSRYARQRTFVEMLQSRIDLRANEIAYEEMFSSSDKETMARVRADQVFDKRLMGYIVELQRELRIIVKIAERALKEGGSVAGRVWQD